MKVVYALQPIEKSIFLAGPTPRGEKVPTWRPQALETLRSLGFDGTVYVPESHDWAKHDNYEDQIDWEWAGLDTARVVVFWVPRDLELDENGEMKMPAFTTNVEYGLMAMGGKCLLGTPEDAPKTKYLKRLAKRAHIPMFDNLEDLLAAAVKRLDD